MSLSAAKRNERELGSEKAVAVHSPKLRPGLLNVWTHRGTPLTAEGQLHINRQLLQFHTSMLNANHPETSNK